MFTNHPKVTAIGAFLAGGVLVGAFTLATGAAHGTTVTTTPTNPGQYESSAQYTAQHAWVQTVPGGSTAVTLSIPSGDRLAITDALGPTGSVNALCSVAATLKGIIVKYVVSMQPTSFMPIYADSGRIACPGPSQYAVTLVGYLTPIP
jgi:hypothetical protein